MTDPNPWFVVVACKLAIHHQNKLYKTWNNFNNNILLLINLENISCYDFKFYNWGIWDRVLIFLIKEKYNLKGSCRMYKCYCIKTNVRIGGIWQEKKLIQAIPMWSYDSYLLHQTFPIPSTFKGLYIPKQQT